MGGLPFPKRATILDQAGDEVATDVPLAIWPTATITTPSGQAYDHYAHVARIPGEAHLVGEENRSLEVDGTRYKVLDAYPWTFVGMVRASLREVRPGG